MNKISVHYNEQRFTAEQNERIAAAYELAEAAHAGQKRISGDPYITHPVAVAEIVADWGLDAEAIVAALLHDVVEDTEIGLVQIQQQFGPMVAGLVDGLTKLGELPSPDETSSRLELSNENLRKLLLATAKDYRVILIKLADRLHNLRTLGYLPPAKRARIARESLEIYAPLADRLGMGQLKAEVEDLAFKYARPEEYAALVTQVSLTTKAAARYLATLKRHLRKLLNDGGVEVESIDGRHKHLYSVFKKLAKVDGDLSKIYDLMAVRIIVPDVAACYQALGLVHQRYKPLIYRIKDYIAVPKPNGYQSLHTTVFAEDGHITEIQIRTQAMHEEAERGLAAHFYYDAHKTTDGYKSGGASVRPKHLGWVNQLANLDDLAVGPEGVDHARLELFRDRIFVFSPRGDLYELPENATPVDFAFAVHSDVGLRAMGAKVNGRMVTLDTKLDNRDVVEILTRREAAPNRDWLNFVQTSAAKNRIRSWFRAASRDTNISAGRSELEAELKAFGVKRLEDLPARQLNETLDSLHVKTLDDLLAAIGEGSVTSGQALRRLVPDAAKPASVPVIKRPATTGRVLVEGSNLPYTLAPCCLPVFPQPIVGYVTRGKGVTVHRLSCTNLPTDSERYAVAYWETVGEAPERLVCRLQLEVTNRIGVISEVTGLISRRGFNIGSMRTESANDSDTVSVVSFVIEVPDLFELAGVMRDLGRLRGMMVVKRV